MIGHAYDVLLTAAVIVLAVLVIFSIIRSVLGPRIADRIIAINMTGTMIIMMIAILSVFLDENYLVDICLIYAMISFLGVVVLCKVYTGVYLQNRNRKATMEAVEENLAEQVMVRSEVMDGRTGRMTEDRHTDCGKEKGHGA